ncbi:MAG: hypothetical protein Q3965_06245 [Rothia sp. (in: high G+C Gram-positive bacteria)]|nr:hypothetical protein [Rothia sp. (in: high G+C Gram-positive bacteria)]
MKNLRAPLGLAALLSLSLTALPAVAATAETSTPDTSTPIGAYWETHQEELGAPTGELVTYPNGSSQQTFEKGLLTDGPYGGVQAILGTAGETFLKAGGAEKFGNAESAPWKHYLCGQSLTTHDGKTRWLLGS